MAVNDGMLQIGEVAERVGLSLRTVRYYDEGFAKRLRRETRRRPSASVRS